METAQALEAQTEPISTEQAATMLYNFAANQLIHQHRASDDVIDMLVEKGVDKQSAETIVFNLQDKIAEAKRSRARKDMLYGGLWFFGGLIITLVTFSNASGGGSYVVAWGAIIFGGIQFFRGIANSQ